MTEYFDYNNVFSAKNVAEIPEHFGINEHAIKLEKVKQLFFRLIYNLSSMELETLKIYIKINLVNNFICFFKSPIGALIFFDQKPNKSFRLYMDYQSLNNFIIKNWYLLPLIEKSLD